MVPISPLKELEFTAWTTVMESDSIIICWMCNSLASMIPSSKARASVTSTEYVAGSSLPLATTTAPLQSRITTPTLESRSFSDVAPSTLILYIPGGGAAQPTSGGCWLRKLAVVAPL